MDNGLSEKIIKRIDEEKIESLPRWRFTLWHGLFWSFAIFAVIIGSLAVGAIIFLFEDHYAHRFMDVPHDIKEFLTIIPYLWLVTFAVFLIAVKESVKHTKKGYRYSLISIIVISLILTSIFGIALYSLGIGRLTHEFLNDAVPPYNRAIYDSRDAWNKPIAGRLAGVIIEIKDNNDFSIMDFNGEIWQIHLKNMTGIFVPEASSTVRMSGLFEASSSIFMADFVTEWEQ